MEGRGLGKTENPQRQSKVCPGTCPVVMLQAQEMPAKDADNAPRCPASSSVPLLSDYNPTLLLPTPVSPPNRLLLYSLSLRRKLPPLHYPARCPPPLAFLPSECPLFPIFHPIHSCGAGGQLTGRAWNRCGGSGD